MESAFAKKDFLKALLSRGKGLKKMLTDLGGLLRACFARTPISFCAGNLKLSTNMASRTMYQEAVYALNGLQSNSATLKKAYAEKDVNAYKKLTDTAKHLEHLGIQVSDLDSLNVIHVAGTKGKGSTCAFVESILRKHGYKTGFYSSPHLVSVNERIRINGQPLDKNLFIKYFWEVYNPLQRSLKEGETMPPYFMFLTIMAFYVFLKEKVEAAVLEVGIGGLYDCTNVIKKPVVVAVTTLGIDHVHLLGNTLTAIAAQKAGIFKPGVPAFTVSQHESAMKVLYERAKEVNCSLYIAPPLEIYEQNLKLGLPGVVQSVNASLAVKLAEVWLKSRTNNHLASMKSLKSVCEHISEVFVPVASVFPLDSKFKEGLESCIWPGRYQTIEKNGLTLYLDGAHTNQSITYCAKWFQEASEKQNAKLKSPAFRVLLFNCTGMRSVENLLGPLSDLNFDFVIFSPNRKTVMKDSSSDQSNFKVEPEEELMQCNLNREIWGHLIRSMNEDALNVVSQSNATVFQHDVKRTLYKEDNILQFCCLSNTVDWLIYKKNIKHCASCDKSSSFSHLLHKEHHIQVLITGSLHLVGGVMALIDV